MKTMLRRVFVCACLLLAARALGQEPPSTSSGAPSEKAKALWEAARRGDATAVTRLLDEGVDVNSKFRYGATALSYACDRGHLEVVKVLLARGADVNIKDSFYGLTPLSWASGPAQSRKPEHAAIVGLLLKHGAQGSDRALRAAIGAADVAMTKVVLEGGRLNAEQLSDALDAAKKGGNADILAALEQAGAKPHPVVTLTAAQLARYPGTYSNGTAELIFSVQGGRLQGGPPGQTFTLVPRSETQFAVEGAPVSVTFDLQQDRAVSLTLVQPNGTQTYKRVEGK
jgi:ankyrin repeat protein